MTTPLIGEVDPLSEEDPRYPDWHKWISVSGQYNITYVIYAVFVAWVGLYAYCHKTGVDSGAPLFVIMSLLPLMNYLLSVILLLGMVSKIGSTQRLAFISLSLFCLLNVYSPRLLIPSLSGVIACFFIYVLVYVVWAENVVDWAKFGVPGYMSTVGPIIGLCNMLWFKLWCAGYFPKFIYMSFCMILMVYATIKEYQKAQEKNDLSVFDYKVTIPVFKRLIAFRVGVLLFALGFAMIHVQESLLGMLKEDVWECTPTSW